MSQDKENNPPISDIPPIDPQIDPDLIDLPTGGIVTQGSCIFLNVVDTSTMEPNPDTLNGLADRFSKRRRAHDKTSTFDNLSAVYQEAIAVGRVGADARVRGAGLLFPIIGLAPFFVFGGEYIKWTVEAFQELYWHAIIMLSIGWGVFLWFLPILWSYMQTDLCGMEDTPIVFDRKRRRVYRLVPLLDGSTERGWRRLFGPVRLQALEYHWDNISVDHWVQVSGTRHSVSRIHQLLMTVRGPLKLGEAQMRLLVQKGLDVNHQILDQFTVGSPAAMGVATIPMWWEYLRRYMDGTGPALPQGEQLEGIPRPRSLWQSMGAVGPFGPRFMWWWRSSGATRFVLIFFIVLFPIMLPFNIAWGICNRISYLTMRKVIWPEELRAQLGEPLHKLPD
ncbi:DUF6708 domain-containing protein [Comamonas sp. NoAH]|uniref:DUF6708 domain-containing protein n=1 Tax=Comamonas halotolerans TaxID=3041496 RepID=UPI0024E0783A|nr:DUF6708 domain-containing protein [Comamonas sp. NoAH]